jgi:hypothetical protein
MAKGQGHGKSSNAARLPDQLVRLELLREPFGSFVAIGHGAGLLEPGDNRPVIFSDRMLLTLPIGKLILDAEPGHAPPDDPGSDGRVPLEHEEGCCPTTLASIVVTIELRGARIKLLADKRHWLATGTTGFAGGRRWDNLRGRHRV